MAETTFREISTPVVTATEVVVPEPKDNTSPEIDIELSKPVEHSKDGVLAALGIDDSTSVMPEEDRNNLAEVGNYVSDILQKRGVNPTQGAYKRVLDELKWDMGLDSEADPTVVLDRMGGVVKAWRGLSFLPANERRRAFMKLARLPSGKDMNKAVFELMEEREVWL